MDTPNNGLLTNYQATAVPSIEYRSKKAVITLGNPRQNCKYFGICRIDNITTTGPVRAGLKPNQCVANFVRFSAEQMTLEMLFLKAFLSRQLLKKYFLPHFVVETPYYFSDENHKSLQSKLFCICKGHYATLPSAGGLSVVFIVRY